MDLLVVQFNFNVDDLLKMFMKGDKLYIDDCFDKFFSIGELVVVGIKCFIKE